MQTSFVVYVAKKAAHICESGVMAAAMGLDPIVERRAGSNPVSRTNKTEFRCQCRKTCGFESRCSHHCIVYKSL